MSWATVLTQVVFPLIMFSMMLGMGMSLRPADFRTLVTAPRAVAIGVLGQMLLLPAIALALTSLIPMAPTTAVGFMVLAACPGGITSNALAFAVRADVALSISLTAISSLLVGFSLPFWVNYSIGLHLGDRADISLPLGQSVVSLVLITIVPVTLGMLLRHYREPLALGTARGFRQFSIAGIVFMCLTSTSFNWSLLQDVQANLRIFAISVLLLGCTMGIAYALARALRLGSNQGLSIVIEIGVQNIALVLLVVLGMLNNPAMANVAVIYGVTMLVLSWLFIRLFRYRQRQLLARGGAAQQEAGDAQEKQTQPE